MKKNSLRTIILPLVAAVSAVAGLLAGQMIGRNSADKQLRTLARTLVNPDNKLTYTLSLIENLYVDSVSLDSIYEKTIPLITKELDPHSVYIPASEMAAANETLDGEFDGIGVVFNMATDTVIVLNVVPFGPSDKAGVRAGDRIITVGDTLIAGRRLSQQSVMKRMRGKRGTTVELGLQRQGVDSLLTVTVTRDAIPIKSLDAAFMIEPGVAFVKLSAFSKNSHKELSSALAALRRQGMRGVVLDLRGNTGGFLDQAILIAQEFLPRGRLIVYTEDKFRRQMREYSDGSGLLQDVAVAVLINEESASSSEILAGAIQDNDRGTIIGRRSFGKGLVQNQLPYNDGSALRLTVARYYTPAGRCIQKPYDQGVDKYYEDIFDRYTHNEFFSADSIRFADSLRYTTVGGRVVYGGGGIMPDIFMPLDTADVTRYYLDVTNRNILYRYTIEYADRHRKALDAVKTTDDLKKLLDSDTRLLEDFTAYAARKGVAPDRRQIERSRELLTAQLRAYIGRNTVLEDAGFYSNIYVIDNAVKKAIETVRTEAEASRAESALPGQS